MVPKDMKHVEIIAEKLYNMAPKTHDVGTDKRKQSGNTKNQYNLYTIRGNDEKLKS